jgi:hypothetical protein
MTKEGLAVGATFLVAELGMKVCRIEKRIVKSRLDPFSPQYSEISKEFSIKD